MASPAGPYSTAKDWFTNHNQHSFPGGLTFDDAPTGSTYRQLTLIGKDTYCFKSPIDYFSSSNIAQLHQVLANTDFPIEVFNGGCLMYWHNTIYWLNAELYNGSKQFQQDTQDVINTISKLSFY